MMQRTIFSLAAFLGGSGVALGAFGAHGLKGHLSPEKLAAFQTGVNYQMLHAVVLLVLAGRAGEIGSNRPAICLALGTLLFSGSLYGLTAFNLRFLGPVTPLGGLFLIAGWTMLLVTPWQAQSRF